MEIKQEELSKSKPKELRWAYEDYFREYLLLLASRGAEGLESISRFPKRIELGAVWHQTLDKMRRDSQDGIERLALVGFKEDRRRIFLPTIPVKGAPHQIPCDVARESTQQAKERFNMVDLIGDIHSHPRLLFSRSLREKVEKILNQTKRDEPAFSPGDLYAIIAGSNYHLYPEFLPMTGITHGNQNIFAFKTKETTHLELPQELFDQTRFEKYWYQKYGFRYLGNVREGRYIEALSRKASVWGVNIGIAQRYQVALYKGKPREDLVRAYP